MMIRQSWRAGLTDALRKRPARVRDKPQVGQDLMFTPVEQIVQKKVARVLRGHRNIALIVVAVVVVSGAIKFLTPIVEVSAALCERTRCSSLISYHSDAPLSVGGCNILSPKYGFHVNHYVEASITCEANTPMPHVYLLVDPPQFAGQPGLRSAAYPLYPAGANEYFSEVVIGTDAATDDLWVYTACVVRLTDGGVVAVQTYYATDDRSGISVRAVE